MGNTKKLALIVLIGSMLMLLSACNSINTAADYNLRTEINEISDNQEVLEASQPTYFPSSSLSRDMVNRRLEMVEDPSRVFYFYELSVDGKVITAYQAKGPVIAMSQDNTSNDRPFNSSTTIEQPNTDGTYGDRTPSVFFFTVDGRYIEYEGNYHLSDHPEIVDPVTRMFVLPDFVLAAPLS